MGEREIKELAEVGKATIRQALQVLCGELLALCDELCSVWWAACPVPLYNWYNGDGVSCLRKKPDQSRQ